MIPAQAYNVIALMASALTPGLGCDPNACDGAESHVCRIVFCVKLSPAGVDAGGTQRVGRSQLLTRRVLDSTRGTQIGMNALCGEGPPHGVLRLFATPLA